jgi:hypothetical protein
MPRLIEQLADQRAAAAVDPSSWRWRAGAELLLHRVSGLNPGKQGLNPGKQGKTSRFEAHFCASPYEAGRTSPRIDALFNTISAV